MLKVPSTDSVIDGRCENSPFAWSRDIESAGPMANHSSRPNAALAYSKPPGSNTSWYEGTMRLVALEPIPAGGEIRINYEDGAEEGDLYWQLLRQQGAWDGPPPQETSWRP